MFYALGRGFPDVTLPAFPLEVSNRVHVGGRKAPAPAALGQFPHLFESKGDVVGTFGAPGACVFDAAGNRLPGVPLTASPFELCLAVDKLFAKFIENNGGINIISPSMKPEYQVDFFTRRKMWR